MNPGTGPGRLVSVLSKQFRHDPILKILLLWFVVGAMVWLFTLWHWQQTARDVDLFDIVAYLLGLPTALVLGWW